MKISPFLILMIEFVVDILEYFEPIYK